MTTKLCNKRGATMGNSIDDFGNLIIDCFFEKDEDSLLLNEELEKLQFCLLPFF